jgi:hypothetical protein
MATFGHKQIQNFELMSIGIGCVSDLTKMELKQLLDLVHIGYTSNDDVDALEVKANAFLKSQTVFDFERRFSQLAIDHPTLPDLFDSNLKAMIIENDQFNAVQKALLTKFQIFPDPKPEYILDILRLVKSVRA